MVYFYKEFLVFALFSESLSIKFEQQRQKVEAEYSARYLSEQRSLSLEQALNLQEQKFDEASRKYLSEIENVSFGLLLVN